MLKKIILVLLMALPFCSFAQKFGVVDQQTIFEAMPATATMKAQLTEASQKYETEFQKLTEAVNQLYTEYQKAQNDATTPETIKERRLQELQEKSQKVEEFRNIAMNELQQREQTLSTPILAEITAAIKAIGAENGFTMIFPKSDALILYSGNDVVDVTPLVKTRLNIK